MPTNKIPVNFRITEEAKAMLERLAAFRGGSQAVLVEQMIREAFHVQEKEIERSEKKKGKKD